jgi:hypothetical protein
MLYIERPIRGDFQRLGAPTRVPGVGLAAILRCAI